MVGVLLWRQIPTMPHCQEKEDEHRGKNGVLWEHLKPVWWKVLRWAVHANSSLKLLEKHGKESHSTAGNNVCVGDSEKRKWYKFQCTFCTHSQR